MGALKWRATAPSRSSATAGFREGPRPRDRTYAQVRPGLRRLPLRLVDVGSRRASCRTGWRLAAVALIAILANACSDGHSTSRTTSSPGADQALLYRRAATDSCL